MFFLGIDLLKELPVFASSDQRLSPEEARISRRCTYHDVVSPSCFPFEERSEYMKTQTGSQRSLSLSKLQQLRQDILYFDTCDSSSNGYEPNNIIGTVGLETEGCWQGPGDYRERGEQYGAISGEFVRGVAQDYDTYH
jgi:hypothetical protein